MALRHENKQLKTALGRQKLRSDQQEERAQRLVTESETTNDEKAQLQSQIDILKAELANGAKELTDALASRDPTKYERPAYDGDVANLDDPLFSQLVARVGHEQGRKYAACRTR
jgi:hypothetical protein